MKSDTTPKTAEPTPSESPSTLCSRSSETPETDALEFEVIDDYECGINVVSSCLARQLERERNQLRCDKITLRVTARDYLRAAIQYQTSPWDLAVVRNYGAAKARLEAALSSENAGGMARELAAQHAESPNDING